MKSQCDLLAKFLQRKSGVTAMEIMEIVRTTCPHKRLSDMKARGWTITKRQVPGTNFHKYFGIAPEAKTLHSGN